MRNAERESPKSGPPMGLMQHVCCRAIIGWRWQMLSELRPADRSCLIQLNLCKFSVWGRFYKREHVSQLNYILDITSMIFLILLISLIPQSTISQINKTISKQSFLNKIGIQICSKYFDRFNFSNSCGSFMFPFIESAPYTKLT